MSECAPVGDRLALLNASDSDREAMLARVIIHGGEVDWNGKFVARGNSAPTREIASRVDLKAPGHRLVKPHVAWEGQGNGPTNPHLQVQLS
jgi:hypothetical protein